MNYQTLELQQQDGWLTIWFNQPETRNPLTDRMRDELMAVLNASSIDPLVRGITLRGRGGVFCAGGDLKSFRVLASGDLPRTEVLATSASIGQLLATMNNMPQVVIAVIEGAAMAGGFGLACSADFVICDRKAKFALTETAIGLSPAQIAPYVINKLGYATARRLMLTAARFDGEKAQEFGFADELASGDAELASIEAQIRQRVLACAPGAIADTKRLLRDLANNTDDSKVIDIASENFANRLSSAEAMEGIAAFFEKRQPEWAKK